MAAPMIKSEYDFMYPDLLSKEGLLFVLRKRFISHLHGDLDTLDKEALVDLYNRFILPSPQRTYRLNRRGQQLTRAQKLLDRKRKIVSPANVGDHSSAKKQAVGSSKGLINHHAISSPSASRLKPPPLAIDPHKKVVSLKSLTKSPGMSNKGDAVESSHVESSPCVPSSKPEVEVNGTSEEDSPAKKKKFKPISWP